MDALVNEWGVYAPIRVTSPTRLLVTNLEYCSRKAHTVLILRKVHAKACLPDLHYYWVPFLPCLSQEINCKISTDVTL